MTIHVRYHSLHWGELVERGWITAYVIPNPNDGTRTAVMVRP